MLIVLSHSLPISDVFIFFFNDSATTAIYTLSLHDALPISMGDGWSLCQPASSSTRMAWSALSLRTTMSRSSIRSEEHTSELQSRRDLVCRLLLEKKNR